MIVRLEALSIGFPGRIVKSLGLNNLRQSTTVSFRSAKGFGPFAERKETVAAAFTNQLSARQPCKM